MRPSQRLVILLGLAFSGGCNCGRGGSKLLNQSGIPQLPSQLDFGNVGVGQTLRLPLVLSNVGSGQLDVTSQATSGPPFAEATPFAPPTLAIGGKVRAVISFAPTRAGSATGTLTVADDGDPTQATVTLTGTGLDLDVTASPASLSFGQVQVGVSPAPTQSVTFENVGTTTSYVSFGTSSTASEYTLTDSQGNLLSAGPFQLTPNAAYVVTVAFLPDAVSVFNSAFTYTVCQDQTTSTCLSPETVGLSGQGVNGTLALTPSPVVFAGVPDGTTATQTVTVSNVGSAPATVSCLYLQSLGASACGAASSFFSIGAPSVSLPATLPPGGSFTVAVTYDSNGADVTDTLDVAYNPQGLTTPELAQDVLTAMPSSNPCSLTLSATSLFFSYPGVGVPVDGSLTLTNTGGVTCQVSGIAIDPQSDPSYALAAGQPLTLTIPPGSDSTIAVVFDLTTGGPPSTRLGNLDFDSNDSSHAAVQVPLLASLIGGTTGGTGSTTGGTSGTTGTSGSTSGTSGIYAGGGAWPRWHHDNVQSGLSTEDTSALTGVVAWTVMVGVPGQQFWGGTVNDYLNSPVVGTDGTVYQLGMQGTLYAVAASGSLRWSLPLEGPLNDPHPGTPIIAGDNSLFVAYGDTVQGSLGNGLFHISSAGSVLEAIPPSGGNDGFDLPPVLTNGGQLLGADDGAEGVGPVAFVYQLGSGGVFNLVASPGINAVADQISAVVGPDDSTYWCGGSDCVGLSPLASGVTQLPGWGAAYAGALAATPAETSDLALDVGGTGNLMILFGGWFESTVGSQQLLSVNPTTAQVVWSITLPPPSASQQNPNYDGLADATVGNSCPAIAADGTVYVGNFDGLHAVDGVTGVEKSGFPFLTNGDDVLTAPALGSDGTIFFGTAGGTFYAIHPDGTLRFKLTAGGRIAGSPAIGPGGAVYFTADDGYLYAVK